MYYQNQSAYYQQQSTYYQQQSVVILAQISQQFASFTLQVSVPSTTPQVSTPPTVSQPSVPFAPQVSLPSTSPPPYPSFKPLSSDIRVNACWLVALVCSLSAALLAILIQQWVRCYMRVFQRYDHPLKRARFRQFFFEGAKGMRSLAELVPRLVHVSLFLFFGASAIPYYISTRTLVSPRSSLSAFVDHSTCTAYWNTYGTCSRHTRPSSPDRYSL